DLRVGARYPDGVAQDVDRVVELAGVAQQRGQARRGVLAVGVVLLGGLERGLVVGARLLAPAAAPVGLGAGEQGRRVVLLEPQRSRERVGRGVVIAFLVGDHAEVVPGLPQRWVGLDRRAQPGAGGVRARGAACPRGGQRALDLLGGVGVDRLGGGARSAGGRGGGVLALATAAAATAARDQRARRDRQGEVPPRRHRHPAGIPS